MERWCNSMSSGVNRLKIERYQRGAYDQKTCNLGIWN